MSTTKLPSTTNAGGPTISDNQIPVSQVSARRPPLPPLRPPSSSPMYTIPASSHVPFSPAPYPLQNTTTMPLQTGVVSTAPVPSIEPQGTAEALQASQASQTQLPTFPPMVMHPSVHHLNSASSSSLESPISNQRSTPLLSHYSTTSSPESSHHVNIVSMPDNTIRTTQCVYPSAYPSQQMVTIPTTGNNSASTFTHITTAGQANSMPISSNIVTNRYAASSVDEERLDRIREARFHGPSTTQVAPQSNISNVPVSTYEQQGLQPTQVAQQSNISNVPVSTYEQQGFQPIRPAVTIGQEAGMPQSGVPYLVPSTMDQRQQINTQMPVNGVHNLNGVTQLTGNVSNAVTQFDNYNAPDAQVPSSSGSIVPRNVLQQTPPRSPTLGIRSPVYAPYGICNARANGSNATVGRKRNRSDENARRKKPEDSEKIIKDALQDFANIGMDGERGKFVSEYYSLLECYENQFKCIDKAAEETCEALVLDCKIPYLDDQALCQIEDESADDANDKLLVKKKFVEAMEALQMEQQPSKRRGNLPKESTAYLKKWFKDNSKHPYPTDEQKKELSRITNIDVTQISHWFINYRKRIWKPNLTKANGMAANDYNKRPRKKGRSQ